MKDLKLRKMFNASQLGEGYGSYMYTLKSMHDQIINKVLDALNERKTEINKSNCTAFAYVTSAPLNGREDDNIEVSEEDIKYITNQMYMAMHRLNSRLIYHNLTIIPKRNMFKIAISTALDRMAVEAPNSTHDLKIYYHVDIMNPLAMETISNISIEDLDKYFNCYLDGFKVKNISIKNLFRADFKIFARNIFDTITHDLHLGFERLLMSEDKTTLKQRISTNICVNEYKHVHYFNNSDSPINAFAKSEVLDDLRALVSNTGLGVTEVDGQYYGLNINKVDIIPCVSVGDVPSNTLTCVIDYTISDITDLVNTK